MKNTLFTLFCLLAFFNSQAQSTVSTFHSISIYWSPPGGDLDKTVKVKYKDASIENGSWHDALPMKYNKIDGCGNNPVTGERYDRADYRGSIVNLTPGVTYDIQLTLDPNTIANLQPTTWSEEFPIGNTINIGNRTTRYKVPSSGTAAGYLLIDGTGSTIDVNGNDLQCIKLVDKSYVIIRGFTLKNAGQNGIELKNCHHIVIEDCDISGWGEKNPGEVNFGVDYQAGIYAGANEANNIVIQRNRIHEPRWDTNSWAEPLQNGEVHTSGPQAVALGNCLIGNNVIRYNECWSDDEHYFNDVLGLWSNASYAGFPGADSDIYGNYIANCWDDGIETEGAGMNVRVWANYITDVYIPIANAVVSIGPLYVWKNISGRSFSPEGSIHGKYAGFMKLGHTSAGIEWMTGHSYVFNNTILQTNNDGAGGLGTRIGIDHQREIRHFQSRNNILHVRSSCDFSISSEAASFDYDYDYDLMNKDYPDHATQELNGIKNASPIYANNTDVPFNTKTGNFQLAQNSPGFDAGVIIPNFIDVYNGAAPDMGAHEAGTPDMIFGVNAEYLIPLPVELVYFNGKDEGTQHLLSWMTASELNTDYFDIQHSTDFENWATIGTVEAAHNSLDQQQYFYRNNDFKTMNYYRLKTVDLDGSFVYSNIISLSGKKQQIFFSPNPARDIIQLKNVSQKVVIKIYNEAGILLFNGRYNGKSIDISHFPQGVYYLELDGQVEQFVKK